MDKYLGMIGLLFFIFFLVATATEAILEFLRRPLEWLKITPPKPKMTIEEAMKLSADFVPNGTTAAAKLDAVQSFVKTSEKAIKEKEKAIESLRKDLSEASTPELQKAASASTVALFAEINELLDRDEDYRVRMLRTISFFIALIICVSTGTNAIDLVVQATPELFKTLYTVSADGVSKPSSSKWVDAFGFFITAAAAASGSSYWHDQLDKVRKLKDAQTQIQKLTK